jgi:DNA-binding NtrC family response regulator
MNRFYRCSADVIFISSSLAAYLFMSGENSGSQSELTFMDAHTDARANGKLLILLVEDDPIIRWASSDMLCEEGFCVIEAGDADSALSILHARSDVRVLFTDIDMPGSIDGLELAHKARKLWPELRILVTSGKKAPGQRAMPRDGRFIDKPYAREQIARDIGRMFEAQA